jgi:tetratricopeptide (TPR) repeat protein
MRAATRGAFDATEVRFAGSAYRRTAGAFDAYAEQWTAMHTEVCEATRVHGEQSEAVMELRMRCLDRRLGELRATVEQLSRDVDREVVERAGDLAARLIDVDTCADVETLGTVGSTPVDPALREKVETLRRDIDQLAALSRTGKVRDAQERSSVLLERARAVGWAHTLALLLFESAWIEDKLGNNDAAEEALLEALPLAAKARDDKLLALLYANLVRVVGHGQARFEDAMRLRPVAEAAVARAGSTSSERALLHSSLGMVFDGKGRYDEALEHYQAALAIRRELHGSEHPAVAGALNSVAIIFDLQGRRDEAQRSYEQVLAIEEKAYGARAPVRRARPEQPRDRAGSQGRTRRRAGALRSSARDLAQLIR